MSLCHRQSIDGTNRFAEASSSSVPHLRRCPTGFPKLPSPPHRIPHCDTHRHTHTHTTTLVVVHCPSRTLTHTHTHYTTLGSKKSFLPLLSLSLEFHIFYTKNFQLPLSLSLSLSGLWFLALASGGLTHGRLLRVVWWFSHGERNRTGGERRLGESG